MKTAKKPKNAEFSQKNGKFLDMFGKANYDTLSELWGPAGLPGDRAFGEEIPPREGGRKKVRRGGLGERGA